MTWRERLREWKYLRKMPNLREGYRTFSLHGDNLWGDSITWSDGAPDGNEGRVHGWVPVRPQVGDRVAVEMKSGRTGVWVFAAVELCSNPSDMFTGVIKGPIGYMDESEAPASASAMQGGFV
jgi:hypothetical protein